MDGCVAARDGILLQTTLPKNAVGNVESFFSGRFYVYRLNILAACDSNCQFLHVACKAPG